MKSINKIVSLCIALAMVAGILFLCGCAKKAEPDPGVPVTEVAAPEKMTFNGSGTQDDPWLVGQDSEDEVTVVYENDMLWVDGDGRMVDFLEETDRPWNDIIADVNQVGIFFDVQYLGDNAFKGAGKNSETFDVFVTDEVREIGRSVFEDANFCLGCAFSIPENVEKIGSRAFANTNIARVDFFGKPAIADDAFQGTETEIRFLNRDGWTDSDMQQFGGKITYVRAYTFDYEENYGEEDITGTGTVFVPEDEMLEYDASEAMYDDKYIFDRYELVSGTLQIDDVKNPELYTKLTDDVQVKIYYVEKDG